MTSTHLILANTETTIFLYSEIIIEWKWKCFVKISTVLIDMIFVWRNPGVRTVRVNYKTATVYVGKQIIYIKVKNDVTWLFTWRHFIICFNKLRQNVFFCPPHYWSRTQQAHRRCFNVESRRCFNVETTSGFKNY